MPNYKDGKIYKIVNNENGDVYIGSTTEPTLTKRLTEHVAKYKMYLNGKTNYVTSFKIIESGNYDIQLIELYPCKNKKELHAREGYWIKLLDCINKCIAGQTKKEYDSTYYQANKEVISEKQSKQHECICGGKFTNRNKAQHERTIKHQTYINSN